MSLSFPCMFETAVGEEGIVDNFSGHLHPQGKLSRYLSNSMHLKAGHLFNILTTWEKSNLGSMICLVMADKLKELPQLFGTTQKSFSRRE